MNVELISSSQNPLIKRIRAVKTRKGRQRERAFWVEGLAHVLEAIQAGWDVQELVRAPDLLKSDDAAALLEASSILPRDVAADVFERISDRDGPTGLGAIVSARQLGLGGIEIDKTSLITILVEPQDPGNLGSILRTAYSAGVDAVVLVGQSTDPFDPRAVRASMGALFRVPIAREGKIEGLIEWAEKVGLRLIGTSARADRSYRDVDYTLPAGIVMGNEQRGIPDDLTRACDVLATIPMVGTIRSLNLSAATAVVLYEAAECAGRFTP